MKKTYKIEVDCANCAMKMENLIQKIDGIKNATVNFMMQKVILDIDDAANVKKIMKEANRCVKKIDSDAEIYE